MLHLPQCVASNAYQTFRAKFGRETPNIIKVIENERGEMEEVLMGVIEPGPRRQCNNSGIPLNLSSNQANCFRTEEP